MSISQTLNLSQGDLVIIPKSPIQLVQHYGIYAGNDYYYENKIGVGVVFTHESEFFAGVKKVTAVHQFNGTPQQLFLAMTRAKSLLGRPYDLFSFNCEHYANYVLNGKPFSQQVENAKDGGRIFFVLAVVAMAASKQ